MDTAGFVADTHSSLMEPCSTYRKICIAWVGGAQCGMTSGSTFHSRASSSTWSGFSQLRKPGRSPSAPHSRVFCAVGWPFICRTPQPGRPIIPRSRCRLFTPQDAAVAWWDW